MVVRQFLFRKRQHRRHFEHQNKDAAIPKDDKRKVKVNHFDHKFLSAF